MPITLYWYFFKIFLFSITTTFAACILIIFLADFIEQARSLSGTADIISTMDVAFITLLRLPKFAEQIVYFAVLFGSITAFVLLNYRLELISSQAGGMSMWQILLPGIAVAFLFSLLTIMVINPLGSSMRLSSEKYLIDVKNVQDITKPYWVSQREENGKSFVKLGIKTGDGFAPVQIYRFDAERKLENLTVAKHARPGKDGKWYLTDSTIFNPQRPPIFKSKHSIDSKLTAATLAMKLPSAEFVSFWQLPQTIELARQRGVATQAYIMIYHKLLSLPLLLCAMVIWAGITTFRTLRSGGTGVLILLAIISGFVVYTLTTLSTSFGNSGLVSPILAAWSVPLIGSIVGITLLFFYQDG